METEPTRKSRNQVRMLASYGFSPKEIARLLGIAVRTLEHQYASEVELGRLMATAKCAATIYRAATRRVNPSVSAAKFWLMTQGGWASQHRYIGVKERALQAATVDEVKDGESWDALLESKPVQ